MPKRQTIALFLLLLLIPVFSLTGYAQDAGPAPEDQSLYTSVKQAEQGAQQAVTAICAAGVSLIATMLIWAILPRKTDTLCPKKEL